MESTQQNVPVEQVPHAHNQHSHLLPMFIVGVLMLLVGLGGGYLLFANKTQMNQTEISQTSPTTIQQKVPSVESNKGSQIPITPDTVSYGYQNSKPLIHYRSKVYSYDEVNSKMNEPTSDSQYPNVIWYGLIQAPQSVNDAIKEYSNGYDEVFDFRPLSNNRNFIVIMRWEKIKGGWDLPIYYFDAKMQNLVLLGLNTWPNDNLTTVPKVNTISPEEKYVAFNMYGCWNCGHGYPEIMLMNLETKTTKRLGIILEFTWSENGSYTYKEYKKITCPTELRAPGDCIEDTKNLPLKSGSFQ